MCRAKLSQCGPSHCARRIANGGASMKTPILLCAICLPALAFAGEAVPTTDSPAAPNTRSTKRLSDTIPAPRAGAKVAMLPPRPPLPEGVTDIAFADFFQMPVGPRGLVFTDKIKALQGKKVRIAGFQVAEMVSVCAADQGGTSQAAKARAMFEASVPGRLMLSPLPAAVNISHLGLCEDLPPQVLFVTVPEAFGEILPQHEGPLLLTGTLDLGNKTEPDARVSAVRLKLDPAPAKATASIPVAAPAIPPGQTQQPTTNTSSK
jgi:hypothetical protein